MNNKEINRMKFLKQAFEFEFNNVNRDRMQNLEDPMSFSEKIALVLNHLRSKQKMENLVLLFNSFNYGAHLLNSVFPKNDNPEQFHSTEFVVQLDERPKQVMGWKEYEEQIKNGVATGLSRDAILWGFNRQAEDRGISLEWSFFPEVPKQTNMSSGLRVPGKE